jgi:medium-chain acyl-[acyl-carrier-protein] hydrolase
VTDIGATATHSRWLPFPPKPDCAVRLLCLPHAGAGASTYRAWAAGLPGWIGACAIQPPGRETRLRDPLFHDVGPFVTELAGAVATLLDRPYAVFGHSVGALTAFELVRELRRSGAPPPVHLFVAGRPAPQLPYVHPELRNLGPDDLAAMLASFGGTDDTLLRDLALLELMAPGIRADFSVNETYRYTDEPALDVSITVFGGVDDPRADRRQLSAWAAQTSRDFALHMQPGGHFAVFEQSSVVHARIATALAGRKS